jgi:hypothetical protein
MNLDTIPEKVASMWHPTIIKGVQGRYAVFGSKWFRVDDSFTFEDALKHWEPERKKAVTPKENSWKVKNSKGNGYYTVSFNSVWNCTCTGFGFRRDCKHVQQIKKEVK